MLSGTQCDPWGCAVQDLELDFSVCCGSFPSQGIFSDSMMGNYCLFGEVYFLHSIKITCFCHLAGSSVAFCFREILEVV